MKGIAGALLLCASSTSPPIRRVLERSDDRAATWRLISKRLLPAGVRRRFAQREFGLGLASGGALYHSTDGGASWQQVDGPFAPGTPAVSLRFDATVRLLHVAYPSHGVWELTVD